MVCPGLGFEADVVQNGAGGVVAEGDVVELDVADDARERLGIGQRRARRA